MDLARTARAPQRAVDAVQLAMSEVFTNAVRHAEETPKITVRAVRLTGEITLEVHDGDPDAPRRRPNRGALPGGHGLHILDAITAGWGWQPVRGGGKVVWFTIRW